MKQRIEVRSQAEFDACVKVGNIAIVIGCRVEARGNSSVVAWENSSVEARENSSVVAWGNSSVVARGNSSVVAWENSSVEARGNSSVEAWGNSSVEARGNSSVVARGSVFVRLFSALSIKASAYVFIMIHGPAQTLEGGNQTQAAPIPTTGAEWCEYNGIDPASADYRIPDIDAAILKSIEANKAAGTNGLNMSSWHGEKCDETNWCNTTHCRAGYAICLAGKAGFALEKRYGPELAGQMIYAVSRPDKPLPDFHASNEAAMRDIIASAADADSSAS
ncbi:MAG: hypothetical protein JWP25_5022 [Bradyrhizobium sp.]|nr:hypothetical protein [Bradyrhizobium sp.]